MVLSIIATIFVLGVLIFVHEFGHFIVAKLSGIRVERFSLGFPPRVWGFKRGDTDYCISWIPLGGYCKMSGMVDESMDTSGLKGESWEFQSKSSWIKFLAIFAGPAMNIVLAVFIAIFIALAVGIGEPVDEARIGGFYPPNFPAEAAGMKIGDLIVEVDGQPVDSWKTLTTIVHAIPDKDITVKWDQDGTQFSAELRTMKVKLPGETREVGLIGISPMMVYRPAGILESIGAGFSYVYYVSKLMISFIQKIVTGAASMKSLGGPLMIGKIAGEKARAGIFELLSMMALLSVNLAILNLLPIPVLDGGHLVFILIESIIRKPLPSKVKLVILQMGMFFILLLIAVIFYNDIVRLIQ